MIQRTVGFIKEVRSELSQVSWAPLPELWASTKVVLVTVMLLSLVIGIFDWVCALLISRMVR